MIGRDDGWKILIGIAPWLCGMQNRSDLYHLKDGLPSIPRAGEYLYHTSESESFMVNKFGERPCEECDCAESCNSNYVMFSADCIKVYDMIYDLKEKEIIILLVDQSLPYREKP